jgi:hypothetical protein
MGTGLDTAPGRLSLPGRAASRALRTAGRPPARSWVAVAAGFGVIALAGCSQALPPLTHPAFSEERWERDDSECSRNATLVSDGGWRLFGRSDTENQVYYRCMVVRGYRPTIPGRRRPAPGPERPAAGEAVPAAQRVGPDEAPAPTEVPAPPDVTGTPSVPEPAAEVPAEPDPLGESSESFDVDDPSDLNAADDLDAPMEPVVSDDVIEPAPAEEDVEPEALEDQ